jgi:hypothetical protein
MSSLLRNESDKSTLRVILTLVYSPLALLFGAGMISLI